MIVQMGKYHIKNKSCIADVQNLFTTNDHSKFKIIIIEPDNYITIVYNLA